MPDFHLSSEPEAAEHERDLIRNPIYEFNMQAANDRNYSPLTIFLRDDAGKIFGGILGDIWGGYLHITFLWVADELRKQGFGSRLLQAAEEEARNKGCRAAFLETHSFQAPDFYRRHGFQLVGQLENYPPEHSFMIFCKTF